MASCKSLYVLCLEFCIPKLENYSKRLSTNKDRSCKWVENLAVSIVEDLLTHAFHLANDQSKPMKKIWKEEWKIFFTSKISSAILTWDSDLINYLSSRCKNLKKCEVVIVNTFDPKLVLNLPKTVTILDFDGELIRRGQKTTYDHFQQGTAHSWLPHAETILKALQIQRTPPSDYPSSSGVVSLSEMHLGTVTASSSDLKVVIKNCPNLRLLRHYQMVTALYELHSEAWKKKQPLPKYKLKNLDVDFSHVVRCRMSPEWVLSPDALRLAVVLCPSATSIRVRFDCSTPHDVLGPLLSLAKIKEFSAVCVSSGERTLLDFADMSPIFEKFGPIGLSFLELKVIEEVEIHAIVEWCAKVEILVLSGCGYVTPATCPTFGCRGWGPGALKKLRTLFYADGDDFSWDHGVPECFWRATLCPSQLQALSFCRFEEITVEDIAAVIGLSTTGEINPCPDLRYVRLSDCEKLCEVEEKRLRKWLKHSKIKDVKIETDR